MDKTHPPVADKVICVDFDGTIFAWGDLYEKTPPLPGAVDFMRALKQQGWTIVIFTSRMSPTWWAAEGKDLKQERIFQSSFIEKRLGDYGIPWDRITAEKVPAEYYIDDKAIEYEGNTFSWKQIAERIL